MGQTLIAREDQAIANCEETTSEVHKPPDSSSTM